MNVFFLKNEYYPKAKRGFTFSEETAWPWPTAVAYEKDGVYYALLAGGAPIFSSNGSPSLTIEEWLKGTFGASTLIKKEIVPGTFHKRMWKPGLTGFNVAEQIASKEAFHQSSVSLRILLKKLVELFEVIEPDPKNLPSFGHKIREVLLLACMEVESSWSAVLREHKYSATLENNWSTNDYIKLLDPMLLKYYAASLRTYPQCPAFKPFGFWSTSNPTTSLVWYNAYNKTKHNRENYLELATLQNAIEAVIAAVIMHLAQFGFRPRRHWMFDGGVDDDIREVFDIDMKEVHEQISDFYMPNVLLTEGNKGEKVLAPSRDWNATEYNFA